MYEYAVVTSVSPKDYHRTRQQYEADGWDLAESSHYRTPPHVHDSLRGPETEARWDMIFRREAAPEDPTPDMVQLAHTIRQYQHGSTWNYSVNTCVTDRNLRRMLLGIEPLLKWEN